MKNYLDYFIPKYQNAPGPLPEIVERNGIYYINGQVVGEKPVSGTDPVGQLWVEGAVLGKPFELGLKDLGLLGKAGWRGLSKVAPKATDAIETGINAAGAAVKQAISKINPFKRELQITAENASKITPEQWDLAYNKSIEIGDLEEAQRLRDLHFLAKATDTKVVNADGSPAHLYHGTPNKGWTVYDKNKFGSATDAGMYGEGLYTTSHKNYANIYAINNSPTGEVVGEVKDFYINGKKPFYIYWNGMSPSEKVIRNEAALQFNRAVPVKGNIPENVWKELNSADIVIEELGKRRPNFSEVVIPKSEQAKLADAITYDNSGKVIPLSKRDNFTNPDIRYIWSIPATLTATKLISNKNK